jgi:hypothetical protein
MSGAIHLSLGLETLEGARAVAFLLGPDWAGAVRVCLFVPPCNIALLSGTLPHMGTSPCRMAECRASEAGMRCSKIENGLRLSKGKGYSCDWHDGGRGGGITNSGE